MQPLADLARSAVWTHDLWTLLGILVAAVVFVIDARRRGRLDQDLWAVVAGCLVGAAIGARAAFVWRYVTSADPPSAIGFLVQGGKSVVGGLGGAYAGVLVAKRLTGYRGRTGDLFAPAVAAGIAVGRIGCLLTEAPGTPTSLPWGMRLSVERIAVTPGCDGCVTGVAYHPSFLYEIAFLVALFFVLRWLRPRLSRPADVFPIFLLSYAVFRFCVEFVRGNPEFAFGLSGTQVILLPSSIVLGVGVWRRHRRASGHALHAVGA